MKLRVQLELRDVYGGDGELRYEPKERVTLSRTRTKRMIRDSIGVAVQVGTEEELKEKKLEPIHTFRTDQNGDPILRLGGSHGKFWGAMKECAKQLWSLGDKDFSKGYYAILDMVIIKPVWIPLKIDGEIRVEGIPQEMKGSNSMIIQHFDVLSKANAEITLHFPDAIESKVKKLLQQLEVGTHLNKRRAEIKILNITKE